MKRVQHLQVRFTAEEHALIERAALAVGHERLAPWARHVLVREARRLLEEEEQQGEGSISQEAIKLTSVRRP